MATIICPFRIEVADADLIDLKARLGNARWPDKEPVSDWSQGVPLSYLKELCNYWEKEYDWRKSEARLNELPQFVTEIDGISVSRTFVDERLCSTKATT